MEQPDTLPSETEPYPYPGTFAGESSASSTFLVSRPGRVSALGGSFWISEPGAYRVTRTAGGLTCARLTPTGAIPVSDNWVPSAWSGICDPHTPRVHEPFDEQTSESDIPGIRTDLAAAAFKQLAESLGADMSDAKPAPRGIAAVADMSHRARGWGA